jgi:hypothetical protein
MRSRNRHCRGNGVRSLTDSLVLTGIILLAAGVIGGGLSASGIEIKVLTSKPTKVGLALVGLLAIVLGVFGNKLAPTAPQQAAAQTSSLATTSSCCPTPVTTTLDTTTTTTAPPTTSSSAHPGTGRVFWSGTISLDASGLAADRQIRDLDSSPSKIDPDEGDIGARAVEPYRASPWGTLVPSRSNPSTVALWMGKGEPTQQQCRETAIAAASSDVDIQPGEYACVRTSQGRTARLKLREFTTDVSLQADTTVWDDPSA